MSLLVDFQHLRRSLKSFLFPMFLLSVGAHAAVLFFIPMPDQQAEEEPIVQPLPTETETIQVARLPKLPEPEVEPTPEPKADPDPKPPQQAQSQPTPAQAAATPRPTTTPTQPEATDTNTDSTSNDSETDSNDDNPSGNTDGTGNTDPTLEEKLADASYYEYNVGGTSRGDATAALQFWVNTRLVPENLVYQRYNAADLTIPYRLPDCLPDPPSESAMIGVVVDASGTVDGEPEILGSTGYTVLDQFALEKIRTDFSFPPEGTTKAYTVGVEVEGFEEKCED